MPIHPGRLRCRIYEMEYSVVMPPVRWLGLTPDP